MKTETSPAMELLPLLCLCLLTRSGVTSAQLNGPENIKVERGADVVLPCSLSTKENIEFKLFDWRKVAQKDDGLKEVFLYDAGIHYNNGRGGQSEEFKERVFHFQDELKHGNASIIITNTKISDSGNYTCDFPRLQPPQKFYIQLVVEPDDKVTVVEDSDVILPCSLSTKENIESKEFHWKKVAQKDPKNVLVYNGRIDNNLQNKEFKGRVFHFQDELKHGNASIIIRNTTISDSGVYTCDFPNPQPSQTFYIELVVGPVLKDRTGENSGVSLEPSVTSLEVTKNWARLQCNVKGASPKPEVEWQDSDGNKLPAEERPVSKPGGPDDIILLTTVTKTGNYRCVVTQREFNHQTASQIHVYIHGSPTGWTVGLVLLALVAVVVLAVLVYKRCNPLKHNKGPANVQDLHPNIPLLSGPANVPDPQTNIKDNPVTVQMQPQEKQSCGPANVQDLHPNIPLLSGPANVPDPQTNIKDNPVTVQMQPQEKQSCGPGTVQMQPQEKPSCDPENQSSSTHTYEIPNHVRGQKQNPSCGSTPEPNALHPFMMEERL